MNAQHLAKTKNGFWKREKVLLLRFGFQYSLRTIFPQSKSTEKQEKQVTSVRMEPRATRNAVGGTKDVHVSGPPLLSGIVLTLGYPRELGVGERAEGGSAPNTQRNVTSISVNSASL